MVVRADEFLFQTGAQTDRDGHGYYDFLALGKKLADALSPDELGSISATIAAGGSRFGSDMMDALPKLGAIVCYGAVEIVRHRIKIDDSLDVFAVHGVGGILGTLMAAVLASPALGGGGWANNACDMGSQLAAQAAGVGVVCLWSFVASLVIVLICKYTVGLRAAPEHIYDGLDLTQHGERAYTP